MRGPVAPGSLQLEHHLARSVGLYALVGQCRAGGAAARLFQRLAVVGAAACSGLSERASSESPSLSAMQTESPFDQHPPTGEQTHQSGD
jgi:hypothetical protein